jgi:hypothetical protein
VDHEVKGRRKKLSWLDDTKLKIRHEEQIIIEDIWQIGRDVNFSADLGSFLFINY